MEIKLVKGMCILQGDLGVAYSDNITNPIVSRLDSGAYTILGGNPKSKRAIDLIRYAPINVVTPENEIWEQLLYDDFLVRGIGFCVKYNDTIVSAITSMAATEKMINVEIETHYEFRNKSLGTAVSARLLLYCIENKIEAQWLAANKISEKLALKLGYSKSEIYKTLIIE